MIINFREAATEVSEDIVDLLCIKNHDYGDAWRKHGIAGILVRISDKSLRLITLNGQEALVVNESSEDTLRDIAGYAIFGLIALKEQKDLEELIG